MKLSIQFERSFNFFLADRYHAGTIEHALTRRASIKDIIESFGVPHTEVGQILFQKRQVPFSFIPIYSGRLDVSGINPPFNVLSPSYLRPKPFDDVKFIADINVIRLGKLMIMLGFDVSWSQHFSDPAIADMAEQEQRIVLTRDTRLLKRTRIVYARRVRENRPYRQLTEVLSFFGLKDRCRFFSRCSLCNEVLVAVEKKDVFDLLEPKTRKYYDRFFQCQNCTKVYWKGSHHDHLRQRFKALGLPINR